MPAAAAQEEAASDAVLRKWTSHDEKYSTQAVLAGFRAAKVRLEKTDGKTVEVPFVELSEKDQQYVRRMAKDDPEAVEHLKRREVETELDKGGRIQSARFAEGSRVALVDLEALTSLPRLQSLQLHRCRFSEPAFTQLKNLVSIAQLDLSSTAIGNKEARLIAQLGTLRTLSLSGTKLTNTGLAHLKKLTGLEELYLDDTKIGDQGIAHLQKLTKLKKLSLQNVKVSPLGVTRLRQALPKTEMQGSSVRRR